MAKRGHKYIFVIGGVMSGVGKGIATSSLANILQARGYSVNTVKVDPYLNVDAGTMNPTEHGEVFVLDSGLETDQDMGNYERFLNRDLPSEDYVTSGMVYKHVIEAERALKYGGKCVEAIPHIRDEIIRRYELAAKYNGSTISVIEIGGTVGDFQNALFIEAARVLKVRRPNDVAFVMVSYLPIPGKLGEMKTRPTQNAIRQLNSYGVQPDFIIARSKVSLDDKRKEKLATTCNVAKGHVISAPDIDSIYEVPLNFEEDKLGEMMLKTLNMRGGKHQDLNRWKKFVTGLKNPKKTVRIAIVGKYFDTGDFTLSDAYLSVIEAIKFSGAALGVHPEIEWVNSKQFTNTASLKKLKDFDGILVPGGFGETGIEGKIKVIEYARKNKIPYLGLCYGLQLMLVEYARNVMGLSDANTVEINPNTPHPVVDVIPEQKELIKKQKFGGTMRLGAYEAHLKKGTVVRKLYGADVVSERHRHRYEVNPEYIDQFTNAGMVFSGASPDGILMEFAELPEKEHPFFVATQAHPEFKARPLAPHPLFTGFLKAATK